MIAEIILITIQVLTIAIILRIVVSWVVMLFSSMRWLSYNPVVEALYAITEPILQPIRSVLPNLGGFDFSPMIAIILLQFIGQVVASNLS
jgi:YggT family protein